MELTANPYQPSSYPPADEPTASPRKALIAVTVLSAALPLLLASLQRLVDLPNMAWLIGLMVSVTAGVVFVQGWLRLWSFLLCLVVFVKFTILAAVLDLVFYGFDGVH